MVNVSDLFEVHNQRDNDLKHMPSVWAAQEVCRWLHSVLWRKDGRLQTHHVRVAWHAILSDCICINNSCVLFGLLNPLMLLLSEPKTKRITMCCAKTTDSSGRTRMRKIWHGNHLESTSGASGHGFNHRRNYLSTINADVSTFVPFGFILL